MEVTDEMVRAGMSVLYSYEDGNVSGKWSLCQGAEDEFQLLSDREREELVRDILTAASASR